MRITKMLDLITNVLNKDADTQVDVCLTSQMVNQIELWTRMYENRSPWVNNKDVLSANLAPAIASEIARLVTLELKSEVTGGTAADYLNEQYQRKVIKDLRRYVEYGCAKGGLVMKPYITQQGIEVQFVQADCFFPLSFDSSGRVYSQSSSGRVRRYTPGWRCTRCRENRYILPTVHLWPQMITALAAKWWSVP